MLWFRNMLITAQGFFLLAVRVSTIYHVALKAILSCNIVLGIEWRCGLKHSIQRDGWILLDVLLVPLCSTFIARQCLFKIPNTWIDLLHCGATSGCFATISDDKCEISQPPHEKFLDSSINIQLTKNCRQLDRAFFFFFFQLETELGWPASRYLHRVTLSGWPGVGQKHDGEQSQKAQALNWWAH